MEVVDQILDLCKSLEIKVLLDLVPNHCSFEHEWFKKALDKDPKYRDFFIWRKGKNNNQEYPNNWASVFAGPAWTFDEKSKEYYTGAHNPG